MPAGQPTKYNEDMQFKADAYVNGEYKEQGDVVPSQLGMADTLGVCTTTLENWGKEYPQFLGTLRLMMAKQGRILVNKGLSSEFNSTIAKLMLHNHGYSDKSESKVDATLKESKSEEEIEAAIAAVREERLSL